MAGIPARPNGGRPMKPAAIQRFLAERPATQEDLEEAAKALGYESAAHARFELAEVETRQALVLLMLQRMALRGSQWAIQNLIDRWVPKPRRVELTGANGGAVALTAVPPSAAGSQEAADYFARLESAPLGEADAYDDSGPTGGDPGPPTSGGYAGHEIIDVEAILAGDDSGEDLL
jgi:hypothetical protein